MRANNAPCGFSNIDASAAETRLPELVALDMEFHALVGRASHNRALMLAREPVAAIVSDHLMPDLGGAALLAQARCLQPGSFRILLSGARDDPAIAAALEAGDADAFQAKPWRFDDLLALLNDARAVYNAGSGVQTYNGVQKMRKR